MTAEDEAGAQDPAEEDARPLMCLILGTAIGDNVADLNYVLKELGELEPGSAQCDASLALANSIIDRLDEDTSQAMVICGLPGGVEELMGDVRKARASGVLSRGDLDGIRAAALKLSDRLGKAATEE
jgi:hypothetical protein